MPGRRQVTTGLSQAETMTGRGRGGAVAPRTRSAASVGICKTYIMISLTKAHLRTLFMIVAGPLWASGIIFQRYLVYTLLTGPLWTGYGPIE